jgi:hypothetical protein
VWRAFVATGALRAQRNGVAAFDARGQAVRRR